MKLLYLLPYNFVPPNLGNKTLIYNLLMYMSRYHDCDVVIMMDKNDDEFSVEDAIRKPLPGLKNIYLYKKPGSTRKLIYRLLYLFRGFHPSLGLCENRSLKQFVKQIDISQKYDVIHIDMFYMTIYKKFICHTKTLLVPSDSYSLAKKSAMHNTKLWHKKVIFLLESIFLSKIESTYYRNIDLIAPVSPVDATYLKEKYCLKNVKYAGIAISDKLRNSEITHLKSVNDAQMKGVLCTGGFSNEHVSNGLLSFLQEIKLSSNINEPAIGITVLGKSPYKKLQEYIKSHERINYIDFVEDYYNLLDNDWIYVYAQQCGSGLQTKVQQALASGLPVVGFSIAFSGIPELVHGIHCYICDTYHDMCKYTFELAADKEKRVKMGHAARKIICENYSEDKIGEIYAGFYRSLF